MRFVLKKSLLFIAVALTIGILLVGCDDSKEVDGDGNSNTEGNNVENNNGNNEASGSNDGDFQVGDQFKADEKLTLSLLYSDHPNYPVDEDWLLFEEIEKRTNVELDLTVVPMSDYTEKRSLLVSSGKAPLIIRKTYPGEETPFVASDRKSTRLNSSHVTISYA